MYTVQVVVWKGDRLGGTLGTPSCIENVCEKCCVTGVAADWWPSGHLCK